MGSTDPEESRLLGIYLNDHLAGSTGGRELARRTANANRGTEFGGPLQEIASEIAEDRASLKRLMDRLGVRSDPLKPALAWGMEKVGRLKPNGQLRGYSPLSRVLELEWLVTGVSGSLCLWRAQASLTAAEPRLDAAALTSLERRAEGQLQRLHELRDRAAVIAFGAA